jgi:hypothetical protein
MQSQSSCCRNCCPFCRKCPFQRCVCKEGFSRSSNPLQAEHHAFKLLEYVQSLANPVDGRASKQVETAQKWLQNGLLEAALPESSYIRESKVSSAPEAWMRLKRRQRTGSFLLAKIQLRAAQKDKAVLPQLEQTFRTLQQYDDPIPSSFLVQRLVCYIKHSIEPTAIRSGRLRNALRRTSHFLQLSKMLRTGLAKTCDCAISLWLA